MSAPLREGDRVRATLANVGAERADRAHDAIADLRTAGVALDDCEVLA